MKEDNIIKDKSYTFAIRIVKVYRHFIEEKKEYALSKQLLRAGTSIGANVEESVGAQSRKDFLHKLQIAYKEARETKFWLRLLRDTDYLESKLANSLLMDCEELLKLLGRITKTVKEKNS